MQSKTWIIAVVILGVGILALIGDQTFGLLGGKPAAEQTDSVNTG